MKKKLVIVLVVILAIVLIFLGYQGFLYFNPDCGFKIGVPLDESGDIYIENLTYSIKEKSIFGADRDIYDKSAEILDGAYELQEKILEEYSGPMHINISVNESKGKTEVIFEGVGINKETGRDEDIKEKVVFDFVVK